MPWKHTFLCFNILICIWKMIQWNKKIKMYIFHPLVFIHRYIYIFLYAPCFKAKLYMMILFYFHNLKIHIFHIIINIPTERDKMCDKIMLWAIFIYFFCCFLYKRSIHNSYKYKYNIIQNIYKSVFTWDSTYWIFIYFFLFLSLTFKHTLYNLGFWELI